MSFRARYQQLLDTFGTIADLSGAVAVLGWDEQTYMPPQGARARARQKATLERLAHELLTAPTVGELIEQLEDDVRALPADAPERALIRLARRAYDRAVKLPAELVQALSQASSEGFAAWLEARQQGDYEVFRPKFERLVALQVEKADALGWRDCRYDALLDLFEPDLDTATVRRLFAALRDELVPIVRAIGERVQAVDASILRRHYPADQQWAFTLEVLKTLGFDFERGRQDRSEHPFTTSFSVDDVRITTRIWEDYLPAALFATIHEAGHALYDLGLPREWERTPLCSPVSLGVHESQSRLWENVIGRSRAFWQYFYPRLQQAFSAQLGDVPLEVFYRAINRVEPSLIRVEADEVTYNLHIFLRFELEQALLDGDLAVRDVPEAWNAKMREYLGVEPGDVRQGPLQDVHWSGDSFGYFPTYTLGNILAVQFYARMRQDHPDLDDEIRRGRFSTVLGWLREHIHRHGARYTPQELVQRVTGRGIEIEPYLDYIRNKYGEIYGL